MDRFLATVSRNDLRAKRERSGISMTTAEGWFNPAQACMFNLRGECREDKRCYYFREVQLLGLLTSLPA